MKQHRLVVLIDEDQHQRLRAAAVSRRVSAASLVRQAIDEKLAAEHPAGRDVAEAVDYLCREHDPDFDWQRVKRELERRHG